MVEREEEYVVESEVEYVVERAEEEYAVETIAFLASCHHGIQDGEDSASNGMEVVATYFVPAVVLVIVVVFHSLIAKNYSNA